MTRKTDSLHEDVCTFAIKSQPFLKMRNILNKALDKIKTHCKARKFLCPENHAVYEIMWEK